MSDMMMPPGGAPMMPGSDVQPPEPPIGTVPQIAAAAIVRQENKAEPDPARAALVKELVDWAKDVKSFRQRRFDKMRADMAFVRPGNQWKGRGNTSPDDQPYEANLVQRHIAQRVAALYAKNPKVIAKRRKRMDFTVWDGNQKSLQDALQRAQGQPPNPGDPMKGIPPTPAVPPHPTPEDVALINEVAAVMQRRQMLDKIADTLEILYHYFQSESTARFKVQMKQLVRRTETTGVGVLQLGFQRLMQMSPEIAERKIADYEERITHLEVLMADAQDQKYSEYEAQMQELRTGISTLQTEMQTIQREGLVFDFPRSYDVLVGRECTQLRGLVNAKRVGREYHYTAQQIKEIFGVDVGTQFTAYDPKNTQGNPLDDRKRTEKAVACVWGLWDKPTGSVYWICEGYPDFLKEPGPPEVKLERFFPFFFLTFNDIEDEHDIYPPSDVEIIRPMQLEYNRAREGLREHRIANKPGYVAAKGLLGEQDKKNLMNHAPNELIELSIPSDAVKEIDKYISGRPTVAINPTAYDTEYLFTDIQRVSNSQDANFGGTSSSTATESSIAETSRVSALQSNIDDLDDFLSEVAREGGQVVLQEMSPQQVTTIAGPGAVWPTLSREQLAQEIQLEIEAGSSGRPNKALEISNWQQMLPYLIQMPGLSSDWLAKESIKRLDDTLDLTDAFMSGMPSIVAQNALAQGAAAQVQPGTGTPATDPNAQGAVKFQPGDIGVPPNIPGPKPAFPVLPNEKPPGAV